jgi:hypothetical protein
MEIYIMSKANKVVSITSETPIVTEVPKVKYSLEGIISGRHGQAIQALGLSAINFELARQVSNHESLKMPTTQVDTPDALRDLMVMPELEGRSNVVSLDLLVDGLIATCALIKDVASTVDYDSAGRQIRPYAYILDRCRTPISAIDSTYDWRADMTAKVAGEQAHLLGITDTAGIEAKAKARALAQSAERKAYAMAEVQSVLRPQLMTAESSELVDILLDLDGKCFDGFKLAHNSANAQCVSAKKRLEAGQYTVVDPEVVIFAGTFVKDSSQTD